MEERILPQHPQGKKGVKINKTKYEVVRVGCSNASLRRK